TTGTASAAINTSSGVLGTLYNMGTLPAGTYYVSCQGHWNFSVSPTTTGQIRVWNNTAGSNLLSYPQYTTLPAGYTYQPIGVTGIFTIGVASNVIVQSLSTFSGTVQVYVQTSYWRTIKHSISNDKFNHFV
ncbi:MAG: hypothetical protein EBS86_11335, partial [Crocinitomicaceae bacterium]|nr:hypothetical protein [Crocinitomicaceae bacterium]